MMRFRVKALLRSVAAPPVKLAGWTCHRCRETSQYLLPSTIHILLHSLPYWKRCDAILLVSVGSRHCTGENHVERIYQRVGVVVVVVIASRFCATWLERCSQGDDPIVLFVNASLSVWIAKRMSHGGLWAGGHVPLWRS